MPRTKRRFRNLPSVIEPSPKLPSIKLGRFKAKNVTLEEAAINDVVLRIPVEECIKKTPTVKRRKLHAKKSMASNSLKEMIQTSFRRNILNEKNGLKSNSASPKHKNNANTKFDIIQRKSTGTKRYCLQVAPQKRGQSNRVNVNFRKLAEMVCSMRLPSKSWKVVVVMNTNLTSEFKFTNISSSRTVSFSESGANYKILMDGVPVALLGCPKSVDTIRDIELLLDIVHRLSLRDCMVLKL